MPVPSHVITCLEKKTIARDVVELRFTKPTGFSFGPGQFVLFDVPLLENTSDVQTRAYSIASAPEEEDLLFLVKYVPGGRFSRYCHELIDTGATLTMKGPFGVFTLDPLPGTHVILAATGTGFAPFRSQLIAAINRGDTRPIDVLVGVRTTEDLFWTKELETIARERKNIRFFQTLSDPSKGWAGLTGRIQTHIPGLIKDPAKTLLYACGNPTMTKEVKQLAVDQWKIPKKQVHVEGYI